MPTRVAETSWQMRTRRRIGLRKLAGVLDQARQLARAAAVLVDERLGLDPVHAHEARLGQGEHPRAGEQQGDDDDEDAVERVEPRGRQE